jgi:hypothetical protein
MTSVLPRDLAPLSPLMAGKIPDKWESICDVWAAGQTLLPGVVRWSKYRNSNHGGVRRQDSLQHSYSINLLGIIFMQKLRRYVKLDEFLLSTALSIHDHGEGEIQQDTLYIDKNEQGDLQEYQGFVKRFSALEPEMFEQFKRAFLLQFALKNPESFPDDARDVMKQLRQHRTDECYAFDAVERWDYVLYAMEQNFKLGNAMVLTQTLRNQTPKLDALLNQLPGFGEEIWTKEIRKWCCSFLQLHEGSWIEKKGES